MIVYNCAHRFFTLKDEAEAYRISLKLKPGATSRIEVTNREDLAALLNGLTAKPEPAEYLKAAKPDGNGNDLPDLDAKALLDEGPRQFDIEDPDIPQFLRHPA